MLNGFATPEGTARHRSRFPELSQAGHFRRQLNVPGAGDLWIPSIGLGTYLGEPTAEADAAYTQAVRLALASGINLLDTAINYRHQRSERNIGAALREMASAGELQRDEVVVCTKAGYLSLDSEVPPNPGAYFRAEYVDKGILNPADLVGGMHCMSPGYLSDQLERSRRNLGLETIDVFYVHNAETQLGEVPRERFRQRLHEAFAMLEEAVKAGKIRYHGVATWNGFRVPPAARDAMSLAETVEIARQAGGEHHHFRFVQLPFSLGMPEAFAYRNQTWGKENVSLLEAASRAGVMVVGSATLSQGQLTRNLPEFIEQRLGGQRWRQCHPVRAFDSRPGGGAGGHGPPAARVRESQSGRPADGAARAVVEAVRTRVSMMRVFTDSEIRSLLHPAEVVDAIEAAFAREYRATAVMPVRTHVEVAGRGVLLVMPCYDSAVPGLGTKLVAFFENAAERSQASYVLLDPATGKLRALMAANYLTDVRTAATSAVATRHMARRDAKVLGVFGTGRQARSHIEVMTAVWRFERVLVCGSSAERSREFAAAMANELGLAVEPADARTCASQSDVICTCTTSSAPIFEGKWLRPGTHLNLVGAFQSDKREVDSETMRRARIAVETRESALAEAGDLLIPMSEGAIGREQVIADLHEIASGKKAGRTSADEITVFKNLGCALEDLVTATLACQNAEQRASA